MNSPENNLMRCIVCQGAGDLLMVAQRYNQECIIGWMFVHPNCYPKVGGKFV